MVPKTGITVTIVALALCISATPEFLTTDQKQNLNSIRDILNEIIPESEETFNLMIKVRWDGKRSEKYDGQRWLNESRFPWADSEIYPRELTSSVRAHNTSLANFKSNFNELIPRVHLAVRVLSNSIHKVWEGAKNDSSEDEKNSNKLKFASNVRILGDGISKIKKTLQELLEMRRLELVTETNENYGKVYETSDWKTRSYRDYYILQDTSIYLQFLLDLINYLIPQDKSRRCVNNIDESIGCELRRAMDANNIPEQEITRRQSSRLPDAQKDRLNSARRVLLKTVLENKEVLDLFIKVRFSGVMPNEDGMRWLTTDRFPWLQDDVYPKEISFDGHASDDTLSNVNVNLDGILPLMEKTLRLVEHGLERVVVSVKANDRLKEGAGHLVTSLSRLVSNVKQIQRNFEELLSLRAVPKTSDTNEDSSNEYEKSGTSESFRLDWLIVKDSILYLQYLKDATNEVLGLNH